MAKAPWPWFNNTLSYINCGVLETLPLLRKAAVILHIVTIIFFCDDIYDVRLISCLILKLYVKLLLYD